MKPYLRIKNALDRLFALLALIVLLPLLIAVAVWIHLDSHGPVLFKQRRIGRHQRLFAIYKFRTMHVEAPASVATADLANPHRYITRAGRFLRKTSLDELPQLLNVLRGEMSLIGPRPLVPEEREIHVQREQLGVYRVLPGITGWAQVNGRDHVGPPVKAMLDAYYVDNLSLWMDIRVMLQSILCVFTAKGVREGMAHGGVDAQVSAEEAAEPPHIEQDQTG